MTFATTPANPSIKEKLIKTYLDQRISHAQLFFGSERSGKLALAIAYAQLLNCTRPIRNTLSTDACGTCPSCIQYQKLAHPDLHFFFPTATSKTVPAKPSSKQYLTQWREFLLAHNCRISLPAWYDFIGIENKQGTIYADDANEINRILGYKSYASEFKVVIIWMVEKLNTLVAPKLLKILEEPPEKTLFLLISENPDIVIPTIRSRCLPVNIPPLPAAQRRHIQEDEDSLTLDLFRTWMRLCFTRNIPELITFATQTAKAGREKQKSLLHFGLQVASACTAHQFLQPASLPATNVEEHEFILKFSPFLPPSRMPEFYTLLNTAIFHVERNAHGPTLFLDLSLNISRLIKP